MNDAPGINFEGTANIGDRNLFSELKLHIQPEELTCLLGASGVGKSTILRLIAELETGVNFRGKITADDNKPLTGRIGYMAQSGELFPWLTVLDNVLLGARLRGESLNRNKALNVLEQVGLASHILKKPATLSGGEKQRVALARTLMEDRPIVLLDEPFSALDAKTRSEMQELSGTLLADKTVLLVTHDPAEAARLGHSIFIMTQDDGLLDIKTPGQKPVRAVDDDETLACQGKLYRLLRGEMV